MSRPFERFRDWVTDAYPLTCGRLYVRLIRDGVDHGDAVNRSQSAARYAFDAAANRMALGDYFPDFRALAVWTVLMGSYQMRGLNGHLQKTADSDVQPGERETSSVVTCLSELHSETRNILFWHYLDGLTDTDIGVILESDQRTVAAARAGGLQSLRRRLPSAAGTEQ